MVWGFYCYCPKQVLPYCPKQVLFGDFIAIRYPHERFGGQDSWPPKMEEFNEYLLKSDLEDLGYCGHQFTLSNKRERGGYISTKIDRLLVNEEWVTKFCYVAAEFAAPEVSDHSLQLSCI